MSDKKRKGSEVFIVDNSDDEWKVHNYLQEWCEIARAFDIATGYFEIGALLSLDDYWQQLEKIRILMGDEVSMRTKQAFDQGLAEIAEVLDESIEAEKEQNDFLSGVPSIVEALRTGKIEARVYREKKFHAKAYITHSKFDVVGSSALVGSSNFTFPGLHQNVELNIQLRREVEELQAWYEEHWEKGEDVTPEILRTVERHTRPYSPFEIYAKALHEYFRSHELTVGEWEKFESCMYPVLDQYQREGYHALMKIARKYRGALLCDGVGLGKTFVGLMVIERLLFERKRVALLVPKATREDVWEVGLREFLPDAHGQFSNLVVYNHTDLLRSGDYPERMEEVKEKVDAIVIDEAHHFRNISSQRSRKLHDMAEGKMMFMLTATPINNSLYDLLHLIEYFSRREPAYFNEAPLGIHSLRGHFRRMEHALEDLVGSNGAGSSRIVDLGTRQAEEFLANDDLFQELVVQRSRTYVKESLRTEAGVREVRFPKRRPPTVAEYSLLETYGGLLEKMEAAFSRENPLVTLAIYNPLAFRRGEGEVDPFEEGRLKQIVGLIRTLFLKRFESSPVSFQASCEDMLLKLLHFVELHNPRTADHWKTRHAALLERTRVHLEERGVFTEEEEEDLDEDVVPEEYKKQIEQLHESEYNVAAIVMETLQDMEELVDLLEEMKGNAPDTDDKLQTLIQLLQTDETLQEQKVLIFTEYVDTARYLAEELKKAGIGPLDEVDSQTDRNRSTIVRNFAPYYNGSSSAELAEKGVQETRVLISTDVLAEGLNLQDATCIINYDLHWNPVRLMQRIGRVDRRLNPGIEARMVADHPEMDKVRGTVRVWNFLPPDELNRILSLYNRVTHKTLRISKTFGIEGKQLLTPEDDWEALKDFNQAYEGTTTSNEEMRLTYQRLLQAYPDLEERLERMPLRVFSGKEYPAPDMQAVFFCYNLPGKGVDDEWTAEAGFTRWYLYDLQSGEISEDAAAIHEVIRCEPETPRRTDAPKQTLSEIRAELDKHVKQTYLRRVQAPVGVSARLLAWMELC